MNLFVFILKHELMPLLRYPSYFITGLAFEALAGVIALSKEEIDQSLV